MVQLRVKTELQNEYTALKPFQLLKLVTGSSGSCTYPNITAAVDGAGLLNIFYDSSFSVNSEIISVFKDVKTMQWNMKATAPGPNIQTLIAQVTSIKVLSDVSIDNLHLAFGTTDTSSNNRLWYLNPSSCYRKWVYIIVLNSVPGTTVSLSQAIDMYYDSSGNVFVDCHTGNAMTIGTRWKWVPQAGGPLKIVLELTGIFPIVSMITHGFIKAN